MSSYKDNTVGFLKVDGSKEPSTSLKSSVFQEKEHGEPSTSQRPGVVNLRSLSDDNLRSLLAHKKEIEEQMMTGAANQSVTPGIYKVDEHTYWVCPNGLLQEDNIIGMMIVDFSLICGAEIKVLEQHPGKTSMYYDKEFIKGLWFGMFSQTNQKRRKGKRGYELGRTATFALIVKNEFERVDLLGVQALAKDHFYFGNNDGEMIAQKRVQFFTKTKLQSSFEDPRVGELLFGILNQTASRVGFSNLTEEEQQKVIKDHLIPMNDLITSCYPVVSDKRNKPNKKKKLRKPNPIRASPLFKDFEMSIISALSRPVFTDFINLQEEYEEIVFSRGFSDLKAEIKKTIQTRWEILQRFANRTKLRLQAIRKMTNNSTLKKANVTQSEVDIFLNRCPSPVSNMMAEIDHIFKGLDLQSLAAYAFKKDFRNFSQARRYIHFKVFSTYVHHNIDNPEIRSLKFEKLDEPEDVDYNRALKGIAKVENIVGGIRSQASSIHNIKLFKWFRKAGILEGAYKNYHIEVKALCDIPNEITETALKLILGDPNISFPSWLSAQNEKITESAKRIVNAIRLIDLEKDDAKGLQQTIASLIESFRDSPYKTISDLTKSLH